MTLAAIFVAMFTFALVSMPGWILAVRKQSGIGVIIAAGFGSSFLVVLITAVIAEITGYLPAWAIGITAVALTALTLFRTGGLRPVSLPRVPIFVFVFPLAMSIFSMASYYVGFGIDQNPATFRAWYNADWFKHLGHVHALTNFGLPAADIFGGLDRLHYYWLFYVHPAFGASLHGDVINALAAYYFVEIFFFWLLLIAIFEMIGLSWKKATLIAVYGWMIFTASGFWLIQDSLRNNISLWYNVINIQAGNGFLSALNTFIPQHMYMMAGFLSFAMVWANTHQQDRSLRFLALTPVICAGAISTLMGVTVVTVACATIILSSKTMFVRNALICGAVGIASFGVVLGLQVIDLSFGGDALSSPAFAGETLSQTASERAMIEAMRQVILFGPGLWIGIFGVYFGLREGAREHRHILIFGALAILVGMMMPVVASFATDDTRIVQELRYRNGYPVTIGALIGTAFLIKEFAMPGWKRAVIVASVALTAILSAPSNWLNFIWHGWSAPQWQIVIGDDDMDALDYLAKKSQPTAMVLQFPAPPFVVNQSPDTWVPIFAGRPVPASYRSTNWPTAEPQVKAAQDFYTMNDKPVPEGVDWIYLSRALHPDSYDSLVKRLSGDTTFSRDYCRDNACLFRRKGAALTK